MAQVCCAYLPWTKDSIRGAARGTSALGIVTRAIQPNILPIFGSDAVRAQWGSKRAKQALEDTGYHRGPNGRNARPLGHKAGRTWPKVWNLEEVQLCPWFQASKSHGYDVQAALTNLETACYKGARGTTSCKAQR